MGTGGGTGQDARAAGFTRGSLKPGFSYEGTSRVEFYRKNLAT